MFAFVRRRMAAATEGLLVAVIVAMIAGVGGLTGLAAAALPQRDAVQGETLEGVLTTWHADDFAQRRVQKGISLDMGATTIPLRMGKADARQSRPDGTRVRVHGERSSKGEFLVESLESLQATTGDTSGGTTTAAGATTVRVAVVLFNFSNDASQPWTPDTARGVGFTNTNSVSAFYADATYGQVQVTGDVLGWYTIAATNSGCATGTWATQAKSAAIAAGADFSAYQRVVYAFPDATSCSWAGYASGSTAFLNGSMLLRTFAHELGHTFGLPHARSMSCTANGVRVTLSTTCTLSEYGDPFDIMGGSTNLPNNRSRANVGWLASSRTATVTADGTFAIAPAAPSSASLPQLLRIARPDGSSFNLEFRRPYGVFDQFKSSLATVTEGVTIRYVAKGEASTSILDTTPGTTTFLDAPLTAGSAFVDAAAGITIATLAVSSSEASVQITFGAAPSPTPTASPSATATPAPSPTATPTPTPTPAPTATPEPTASPAPDPSPTPTPAPTRTPKPDPSKGPKPCRGNSCG